MAIRYHHRIVSIHPFSNGNGRHARMIADIYLKNQTDKRLNWTGPRKKYVDALKEADKRNFDLLIKFVS